jgi:hypothetical protein
MDSQHYVPRLLLKHFVFGSINQVFVFDKLTERPFPKSIRKVACGPGFDDCEVGGVPYSIDPLLKKIENFASPIIDRIVAKRSLRALNASDREMLALFATVQMLRTDARRKELKDLIDGLHDAVKRAGMDSDKVRGFDFLDMEQTRVAAITSLAELATDLLPEFLNKRWVLYSTTEEHPFYISDNPVARFKKHARPTGPRYPNLLANQQCTLSRLPVPDHQPASGSSYLRQTPHPKPGERGALQFSSGA